MLSISISLVAVFIPILLMGGIVGRLFREFAVTLSVAILVSLCFADHHADDVFAAAQARASRRTMGGSTGPAKRLSTGMSADLSRAPWHGCWSIRLLTLGCLCCSRSRVNIYLFIIVPKGFFPQQDNGTILGRHSGARRIFPFRPWRQMTEQVCGHHQERIRRWTT